MVAIAIVRTNVKEHARFDMSLNGELVVGTYEDFLVGYKIFSDGEDVNAVQSFATRAHVGPVKCVAAAGRYLVSGGADDRVLVHDMKTRTETNALLHHDGTVNAIAFAENGQYLLSGGADGALYAVKTGNWQTHKYWPKAHKGAAVTHVAVHPSDKLALTIGNDKTLRTWNLVKGRQAYVTSLKSKGVDFPTSIAWNPEGELFTVSGYRDVDVWNVANASVENVIKCESKSNCCAWISANVVAVGLENGNIVVFDTKSNDRRDLKAHSTRVKGLLREGPHVVSVSSSGEIKIWKLDKMDLSEKKCVNIGCRITCVALVKGIEIKEENSDERVESETALVAVDDDDSPKISKKRKVVQFEEKSKNTLVSKKPKFGPHVTITDGDEDTVETFQNASNQSGNSKKRKNKKRNKRK